MSYDSFVYNKIAFCTIFLFSDINKKEQSIEGYGYVMVGIKFYPVYLFLLDHAKQLYCTYITPL